MLKTALLVIDPQRDFCDKSGSLYVNGAEKDIDRLAAMVQRLGTKITTIAVTLDSHRQVDISHPLWWKDGAGNHPTPFTLITAADVADSRYTTTQPSALRRSLEYLRALEATKRYPHIIWPYHCLIGSEGHNVAEALFEALKNWERSFKMVGFFTKGSNPWTEHFSAVRAEVPDPNDATTQVNTQLIQTLMDHDIVLLAGEALSHCVHHTVMDLISEISPEAVKKLVLLTDASSPVSDTPGSTMFRDAADDFLRKFRAAGGQVATTTDWLT